MSENPFERYGLDPREGPGAITERMRELVEEADEATRAEIRAAWEQLTLHPRARLRAALTAHPEGRAPLPPPEPNAAREGALPESELDLVDLVTLPSVEDALARDARGPTGRATTEGARPAVNFTADPILRTKP